MARPSHLRRLADDWPVIFAIGVAIWFAIAGLGVSGLSFSHASNNADKPATVQDTPASSTVSTDDVSTTKNPDNSAVIAGPLKIKVNSFRVTADKKSPGTLNGKVTLELRNTTKDNVTFHPSQLYIQRAGTPTSISPKGSIDIGVSPNLPVTAPVNFVLQPDPSASYKLVYAGHVIYQGLPF
jgi:hypothetical protein